MELAAGLEVVVAGLVAVVVVLVLVDVAGLETGADLGAAVGL
jgi:hypothetical protein